MTNSLSIDELQDIWQLASQLHEGQKYGGIRQDEQVEYINHIGSVTFEIIAAVNRTEDMNAGLAIRCAVLHDSIEDTEMSYEKVKELFGQEVADGVMALTKNKDSGTGDKMRDSLHRIKQQPKEVWAVKLADRICNLYAPPFYWKQEKKQAYMEEALLIHEELKDGNAYLAERLTAKIERYKRFLD